MAQLAALSDWRSGGRRFKPRQGRQHSFVEIDYTPDIRSMWGYIVFAFPFVCSSVRSFLCTFVRLFVHSFVRSFVR